MVLDTEEFQHFKR